MYCFALCLLYCFVFIVLCTVNFVVLYLCIVLVSCIVSLYLWGARLQAQPSVQPLSSTKIDKNNKIIIIMTRGMPTFKTEALRVVSNVQLVKGPVLQNELQIQHYLALLRQ